MTTKNMKNAAFLRRFSMLNYSFDLYFSIQQYEYPCNYTSRYHNDQQVDGSKNDSGYAVKNKSVAKAVQMPVQQNRFTPILAEKYGTHTSANLQALRQFQMSLRQPFFKQCLK